MISRFLPEKEDSIVNYYILPLIGLSKKDFGDNFISSKINKHGTHVFVQVKDDTYPDDVYDTKIKIDQELFLVYEIPDNFLQDVQIIINKQYSKISETAKVLIKETAGLLYNKRIGNDLYTSKLIFALDKDAELKKFMFDVLKSPNDGKCNSELSFLLDEVDLTERLDKTDFIEYYEYGGNEFSL